MQKFRAELKSFDFEQPQPLEDALRWAIERLEHGIVQMSNPRYFGLFNPGASFPAQCADRLAGSFNPQLASSASSPVPVALEDHVIRAVARRAAFGDEATGHFATGGSEANYTALICALTAAHPKYSADGVRALSGPATFYTSRDCHIAWLKIAHQAGVGRSALRLVDTDGRGRMDPEALRRTIDADRAAGAVPVMIIGTAGTTGAGMIDPLHDLRRHRGTAVSVVSRRCGVGRRRAGIESSTRGAGRHRAGRLDDHRCAQMAGDDHGMRTVHHPPRRPLVRGISCLDQLHAVQHLRRRSLFEQRAVVAAVFGVAAVPDAGEPPAGKVLAPMSSAASR